MVLLPWCSRRWHWIRSAGSCSFFAAAVANARHSTYSLRFARIAYRWHPLFGRTLQVSPFRRGKDLRCIYTEERPDLCRELPNWMFDDAYCGGMTLGRPEVNLAALHELGKVLALLNKTRPRTARFSSRKLKEKRHGQKNSGLGAAGAGSESPAIRAASDQGHAGADRRGGRAATGGDVCATSGETIDRERRCG